MSDPSLMGARFALVAARWNEVHVAPLIRGAREALLGLGIAESNIDVIRVPGSFEVPQGALFAAQSGRYDAVVGLGVLIRGATLHFELIAHEVTSGLASIPQSTGVPATFGIVTAENAKQALARCGGALGNRGADAALAAAEMVILRRKLLRPPPDQDGAEVEKRREQHELRARSPR